jgi:N-hydroxyarylamine O-acetyltransferase
MRVTAYLDRVGVSGPLRADPGTLRRLHLAHRETFLFENLTIQSGGSIALALPDLERKFLDERRGGYCFEHNTLFAAALRDIGFAPVTLLGRVRRGPPERWCRTHMVLGVTDPDVLGGTDPNVRDDAAQRAERRGATRWLCDVGFGGLGLLEPIELRDGARAVQGGLEYALRREDRLWILSMRDGAGAIMDLYEFSDDPQTPWDVEVANHFTSTHPESVFRRTITIQRSSVAERLILRGDALTRYRDGRPTETAVAARDRSRLAQDLFGVTLPASPLVCDQYPSEKLTT